MCKVIFQAPCHALDTWGGQKRANWSMLEKRGIEWNESIFSSFKFTRMFQLDTQWLWEFQGEKIANWKLASHSAYIRHFYVVRKIIIEICDCVTQPRAKYFTGSTTVNTSLDAVGMQPSTTSYTHTTRLEKNRQEVQVNINHFFPASFAWPVVATCQKIFATAISYLHSPKVTETLRN